MANLPPPPNGQVLSLVSALSNTANHDLHVQAIRARDDALSSSPESYGNLCLQLSFLLVGSDQPHQLVPRIDPQEIQVWKNTDMSTALRLESDMSMWVPFGQMAGLILKNALMRPPISTAGHVLNLQSPQVDHLKEALIFGLGCAHVDIRNVASSIIAATSVSEDSLQPALHIRQWSQLVPALIGLLALDIAVPENRCRVEGALGTVKKIIEDGPKELSPKEVDDMIPLLLRFMSCQDERLKVTAMQSLVACLSSRTMPSALVMQFSEYMNGLSALAVDPSALVRKWVCKSINTLLNYRTEYLQAHIGAISEFMVQSTKDPNKESVAIEACEFWLIFANLDEAIASSEMMQTVERLLPTLIPILLESMVYSADQRMDIQAQNEIDLDEAAPEEMKPVFHHSRNKHDGDGGENGEDDDDDGFGDDDDNEWTLRTCAGASLDSLANLYGAESILPTLLPSLQAGLSSPDPWMQEASILALGAISEGCYEEMAVHMSQLHPFLMTLLSRPETPEQLPQVKSICAWTLGRYAGWAIEQVQSGAQGHLLGQITETLLQRLHDRNRKVQVACTAAFGVIVETAGDLLVPYLEPIFHALVPAMARYRGRSLVVLFDTFATVGEFCGPAIGEGELPQCYIPQLLGMLDGLLRHDPTDRTILPLMEALATVALTCGMNYQPFALETFDKAMCMIEQVQLILSTTSDKIAEEDADPIVCATDLLDGLCEGLGPNFAALVASSSTYGQHFQSVLHALCKYETPSVRMSALALLGDLARNAPSVIQAVVPQLIQEAVANIDPINPSVCNNAVWAVGEICVQCGQSTAPLEPHAANLMQRLISLLMGNGSGHNTHIPGVAENAAACCGRLANVSPNFVAPELSRFLLGWCDGLAKIVDPTERREAFYGFSKAIYANPQAIHQAEASPADAISSILYAIVSWHLPQEDSDDSVRDVTGASIQFQPFPQSESELGKHLGQLMHEIKRSVGEETWKGVQNHIPLNIRQLLREAYQL